MSHPHINTTGNEDDPQPISIRRGKSNEGMKIHHQLDPQHHSPIPTPSSSSGSAKNLMEHEDDEYWGKPIRNSQDEGEATTHQPMNKGEASYVGSNTSYSSSALTNPQSPLLAFRNSIFEFIVSFKRNESFIKSKYIAVAWICLHIYMMYYTLVTCSITTTESEEKSGAMWGVVGGWIWRVLHFPLNFGIQYYPYELVYTFSAICLFVEILCLICFYAYRVGLKNGSRYNDKIKTVARLFIIVVIIFSPFMLFVHTYPLAVNMNIFTTSSSTDTYMKHFTTPLFTASANIGLIVIGSIGAILTLGISVLGFYLVYETIPLRGTKAVFVLDRIYPLCLLLLNNQVGIILTVVLTYELCVISAGIKFLSSILFIVSLFVAVPFYRRWENCVYCGIGVARALGSLGPLICLLVTRDSTIDKELGGILTGITLASMIAGFVLGYVIMEIYTRLKIRSIRNELNEYFADSNQVANIVSELTTKKMTKSMMMFIKFNTLKTKGGEGSDLELARKFIKAANLRSVTDVNLLIIAASFVGNAQPTSVADGGNTALAVEIMRRVLKQNPNFVQVFHYFLRSKEIEANSENYANVSYEVKKLLERLDKKQSQVIALHQEFFKELSSENPSEDKLEKINRKSNNLIIFCENAYKNCMYTNMNNKTLLRAYAYFLETFRFEIEVANELYEEANQIEEEKSKSNKQSHSKSNRIVPYSSTPEESSIIKRRKSDSMKHGVSFDEVVDNWDSISARMEESMKQEAFYRNSINTPEHRKSYYFTFLPFVIVSFLVLLILLTMSLVFSSEFTNRTVLEEKICSIAGAPSIMANHIRSIQARYRYLNESTAGTAHALAVVQTSYVLTLINNVLTASSSSFFPAVTEDFIAQRFTYKVPNKQIVGESMQLYSTMNVSVLEFLNMFENHAGHAIGQLSSPAQLNDTSTNFPVLFFLYNRETMSEAFDWFCRSFLDTSMERADLFSIIFWSTSSALLAIYFLLTGLYIIMLRQYFIQIKRTLIQVFRKIRKDEVGKIYHSLNNVKTSSNIEETVLSPKVRILILTLVTFCVVALVAPIQIYEFQLNKQNHFSTMKTAASVNNVLSSVTSVNFKLTEMILRSAMSEYTWSQLHTMNKDELMEISSSWSYVTRGSPDLGYSNSLFGKYESLDVLLSDSCDNTTFAPPSSNSSTSSTTSSSTTSAGAATAAVSGTVAAKLTCLGLEKLVHGFMTIASELNEDFYSSFYGKTYETNQYFMALYYPTLGAVQLIYDFISIYVQNTKYAEDYLTITSTVLGSVAVILLSWLSYLAMNDHFAENQSVRLLLNYVPKEVVDTVPDMVEYIVNYRLPSPASRFFKLLQRRDAIFNAAKSEDDSMAMTRSILNSAVDGSIVCNPKGEVFLFNPASEDMFAYKKVEILGVRLETLFAAENSERIAKVIESMNTNNTSADTFEVTGLRKNKTTFPALISLSISHYLGKPILSCFVKDITQVKKHASLLGEEKKKSEELLLNILPLPVANRLKQGETFIAEKFADVTIFFSDMVGFTKMSSGMEADQLVMMLNTIVNEFDKLTEKYLIDKIKTIGDAYFAVSGTHSSKSSDHPERMLKFSISVYSFLRDFNIKFGKEVNLRIGMHTGPCVGGVIGTKKFAYDLWGDTINTASRMESTGVPGRIQISRATYERVFDLEYEFEEREPIYVKGKGEMKTYLLKDKHHANPIPKIEELEEKPVETLLARPPVSRTASSSDELTVLKINNRPTESEHLADTQ